jgi:hypothetical protein
VLAKAGLGAQLASLQQEDFGFRQKHLGKGRGAGASRGCRFSPGS